MQFSRLVTVASHFNHYNTTTEKNEGKASCWVLLLSCTILSSAAPHAWAMPVARLRGVRPVVEIQNSSGQTSGASKSAKGWVLAHERSALVFNDTVRTGAHGGAELLFNNGTRIALRANSQLQILAPPDAKRPLTVRLFGALSEIFVRAKGPTEIRTAAGTAAVRGTQYLVKLDAPDHTTVTVAEGTVAFYNPLGEVLVHAGQQSDALVGHAPTPVVAVDPSGLLQWTFDVTALPLPFEAGVTPEGAPPNSPELVQAAALLQDGKIPEATALLRTATERDPAQSQAQALLSFALLQQNEPGEARKAAESAVKSAPKSALSHAALSMALFFQGQNVPARREATAALTNDPLSPLALLAYGRAQMALGQRDEARQALEQAAVLAPDFPLIQRDLGELYLVLDRLPQAETAFGLVLAKNANDGVASAGLGTVYSRTGRTAQAQEAFDAAMTAAPHDTLVRAQRSDFLLDNGQLDRAREETLAFLKDVAMGSAGQGGAQVAADPGDSIQGRPELGAVMIRLSEEALYRQNLPEAFDYGRRAVQLLPASAPAHYQWGRVYLEQQRTAQAQSQFRLAVTLDPQMAKARYALGLTQEIAASGQDFTHVLAAVDAAENGGPEQGLSLRNLQSAGAADRIQAALQDPTVVRSATRSFGDTQIDGSIGRNVDSSVGTSSNFLHREDISVLKESSDRRGVLGLTASRDRQDGVRSDAGTGNEQVSLSFGRKSHDSPSGLFAFGQWEKRDFGTNTGLTSQAGAGQEKVAKPQVVLGYTWQPTDAASTRILLSAEQPDINTNSSVSEGSNHIKSLHGEARHDMKMGSNHWLNVGASWGFRSAAGDRLAQVPGITVGSRSYAGIHSEVVYARDDYKASQHLFLTGELKAIRVQNDARGVTTVTFPPPDGTSSSITKINRGAFAGIHSLLATYQLRPSTSARVRVRSLLGGLEDFELLSPSDDFLFSTAELPALNYGARGRSYEMELNHTFPSAASLQVGVFQQSSETSYSDREVFQSYRFRGARVRYEGLLSARSTFFVNGDFNSARGVVDSFGVAPPKNDTISDIPRFRFEVGMQYLGARGFFVQPTLGYLDHVAVVDDFDAPRGQRGGFALANVRVGKRFGLRRVIYAEAHNLLDKNYSTPSQFLPQGDLGNGRQIVIGFSQRF